MGKGGSGCTADTKRFYLISQTHLQFLSFLIQAKLFFIKLNSFPQNDTIPWTEILYLYTRTAHNTLAAITMANLYYLYMGESPCLYSRTEQKQKLHRARK